MGAGVFTATSLTQKEQLSDLTLANIEALTIPGNVEVRLPDHYIFDGTYWNTTDTHTFGSYWKPVIINCTVTDPSFNLGPFIGSVTTYQGHAVKCQYGDGNCFNGTYCIPG